MRKGQVGWKQRLKYKKENQHRTGLEIAFMEEMGGQKTRNSRKKLERQTSIEYTKIVFTRLLLCVAICR